MARALTMRLDERKLQARGNTQVLLLAQKKQGLFFYHQFPVMFNIILMKEEKKTTTQKSWKQQTLDSKSYRMKYSFGLGAQDSVS